MAVEFQTESSTKAAEASGAADVLMRTMRGNGGPPVLAGALDGGACHDAGQPVRRRVDDRAPSGQA